MNKKSHTNETESTHRLALLNKLQDFKATGAFTDITLVADGEKFKAHKLILASFSPYFQTMFLGEMLESRESVIRITGITPTGLRIILNYMYTSELEINHVNVQDILASAVYTQVQPVVKACADFLRANLDVENCADIGIIAENYCLDELKIAVFNFVGAMFSEVAKTKDFHKLTPEMITYAVSSDMPIKETELVFLKYILYWFLEGNDEEVTRKCQHAEEIIEHIRFSEIPPASLDAMLDQVFRDKHLDKRDGVLHKTVQEYSRKWRAFPPPAKSKSNMRGMQLAVVKVGGFDSDGLTNEITFSLVNEKHWKRLTRIPRVEQCNYGTAVLNNELYVVGGCFNQFLQEVIHNSGVKYNARRNEWVKIKSMRSDRCRFTLTELNGKLYAVAGAVESAEDCDWEATKTAECYDPESDQWSFITSLPECRQQHAAASFSYMNSGLLFISGGLHKDRVIASMFMYNTDHNIWTSCAPLLSPRADHFMISYERKLYVCGGWREHPINPQVRVQVTTIDCYDITTDTWTFITNIPTPRFHTGVIANDSKIYFIGGFHQDTIYRKDTAAIECYDIATDTWTNGEKKSQDFWEHACVMLYVPKFRAES